MVDARRGLGNVASVALLAVMIAACVLLFMRASGDTRSTFDEVGLAAVDGDELVMVFIASSPCPGITDPALKRRRMHAPRKSPGTPSRV